MRRPGPNVSSGSGLKKHTSKILTPSMNQLFGICATNYIDKKIGKRIYNFFQLIFITLLLRIERQSNVR